MPSINTTTAEGLGTRRSSSRPAVRALASLRGALGLNWWRRSLNPTPRSEQQPETEEALRQSEDRFRSAFDNAPIGMALISPDSGYLQVNSAFCDMVGRSEEELIGTWAHDITHPDDLDPDRKSWQLKVSGQIDTDTAEKRYIHADGHTVWVRVSMSAIRQSDGRMAYAIVQAVDLTESRRAERAIRNSEERFRSSFDKAPIGMALISPDSGYMQVNSAFCDMVGRSEEELIGTWAHDITHPDDLDIDGEGWQLMVSGQVDTDSVEKRYIHADGHTVWARVDLSAVRHTDGSLGYAIVQAVDLTGRKEAEAALQESEERFRSAFDEAPIGMALISPDSGYMQVNSAFCDMVGRNRDELIGIWPHDITHPGEKEPDRERWQRMLSGEVDQDTAEKRYLHADGHAVWVRVNMSAIREADGSLAYGIIQAINLTETRRAETAIRNSEKRFRSAFDKAPIGMALISPDSGYMQVNSAFCDMVGRSEEELLDGWAHDITHPDDLDKDREDWQLMVSGKTDTDSDEKRYLHADGRTVWARVDLSAVRHTDGSLAYAIVQAVDLTGRKAAEAALQESEERFRSAFDHAPIGVALTSPEGGRLQVNQALCEMLGRSEEQLVGGWAVEITHPDDMEANAEMWQRLVTGGADNVRFEKRYIHADGHTIWAYIDAGAIRNSDGSLAYGIVQAVDLTSRKEAEAALQESEERFRSAFDHAPIGMALISAESGYLRVNQALCEILGRAEEELLGTWPHDYTHPDDLGQDTLNWPRLISNEIDRYSFEKRYIHAEGRTIWAYVDAGAVHNTEGHFAHAIVQVVDITARKEAEKRLQQLVVSKDQFVASVSHELRTPLTAVIGLAHELRDNLETFSAEESHEFASLIADQSTEVGHIVEDLLVAARADIGEVSVFPQTIDLLPTVEETIHSLPLEGSHVDLPTNTAKAWADPTRLRQIMRNLVTNAVRYGGDEITIGIVEDTDRVFLEVSDEGEGIPEEQRESIFDAYHNTGKDDGLTASVGLGLTISRKLARLMGGDLSYRYEDGWSKFVVDLPVADKSDSAN